MTVPPEPFQPIVERLLGARLIANLATFNRDGTIHLVPMWFLWDGALLMPTEGNSRKARNLSRDARATVAIHDSKGGLNVSGAMLVGAAEIVREPLSLALNERINRKYVTEEGLRIPAVASALAPLDVTIRFRPTRVASWDFTDTPGARALLEMREFLPLAPTDRV